MTKTGLERRTVLAAAATALTAGRALAAYPERPVRWIVPYPAGGGTDVIARIVGNAMGLLLRQSLIIENRPGASTNLAADGVAKAPPDGYTLLTADNATLVNNQALFSKLPFDADRDLRPIGLLARFHLMLTVSPTSSIINVKDFVARAAAAPGVLNFGSPGVGSPHYLAMIRLARNAGITLTHVPYRGTAPLITDLMAGNVETGIVDYAAGGELMRSGQVRPLAACSANRLPGLPDVPTIREALGLPSFEAYAWQGLMTTGATPDDVATILGTALASAMSDAGVARRMTALGVEPLIGGPMDFKALIQSERAIWVPLIRELGLTVN